MNDEFNNLPAATEWSRATHYCAEAVDATAQIWPSVRQL
jgi:hypothetical protein